MGAEVERGPDAHGRGREVARLHPRARTKLRNTPSRSTPAGEGETLQMFDNNVMIKANNVIIISWLPWVLPRGDPSIYYNKVILDHNNGSIPAGASPVSAGRKAPQPSEQAPRKPSTPATTPTPHSNPSPSQACQLKLQQARHPRALPPNLSNNEAFTALAVAFEAEKLYTYTRIYCWQYGGWEG